MHLDESASIANANHLQVFSQVKTGLSALIKSSIISSASKQGHTKQSEQESQPDKASVSVIMALGTQVGMFQYKQGIYQVANDPRHTLGWQAVFHSKDG